MFDSGLEQRLLHIREATEEKWIDVEERSLQDFIALGVGGSSISRGTKWLPGLSSSQIETAENAWEFAFPEPMRTYLSILNVPDKPLRRYRFVGARLREVQPGALVYDWTLFRNPEIEEAYEHLYEGICFDIEQNGFWPNAWGTKPELELDRRKISGEYLDKAPRIMPLWGNRFLSTEPLAGEHPVFSINQTDIILFGVDIADALQRDFLGTTTEPDGLRADIMAKVYKAARSLPFWCDLMFQDD